MSTATLCQTATRHVPGRGRTASAASAKARSARRVPLFLARFAACERGATSIEYGLICSLIFMAIVAGVRGMAARTAALHTNIQNQL